MILDLPCKKCLVNAICKKQIHSCNQLKKYQAKLKIFSITGGILSVTVACLAFISDMTHNDQLGYAVLITLPIMGIVSFLAMIINNKIQRIQQYYKNYGGGR